jgi:hypothetical protein
MKRSERTTANQQKSSVGSEHRSINRKLTERILPPLSVLCHGSVLTTERRGHEILYQIANPKTTNNSDLQYLTVKLEKLIGRLEKDSTIDISSEKEVNLPKSFIESITRSAKIVAKSN